MRRLSWRVHHIGQCRFQRSRIQLPFQTQRQRDVVGRARALPAGAGTTAAAAHTTAAAVRPRLRHQRRRGRPRPRAADRPVWPTVGASNRARIASSTPSCRADAADQPRRQQRVPAQVEEVVVDAHALATPSTSANRSQSSRSSGVAVHGAPRLRRLRAPAAPCGRACRWASAAAHPDPRTPPAPCSRAAARARCAAQGCRIDAAPGAATR